MPTLTQLVIKNKCRKRKHHKDQTKALAGGPERNGVAIKVYTTSPKKPNSAVRKVAKVKLNTGRKVIVGIPGQGHNVKINTPVAIRGGRMNDVPGVRYKIIVGKRGVDNKEKIKRLHSRSKYHLTKEDIINYYLLPEEKEKGKPLT
jgi:small subunit ribosomal protein S12